MHLIFFAKQLGVRYVFMKIEHVKSFKKRSSTRPFGQCRPKFDVCLLIGSSNCKVNLCEAVFFLIKKRKLSHISSKGLPISIVVLHSRVTSDVNTDESAMSLNNSMNI